MSAIYLTYRYCVYLKFATNIVIPKSTRDNPVHNLTK